MISTYIPPKHHKLDLLMEGKAWVKFAKADQFVKKDMKKQNSVIKSIMEKEKIKCKRLIAQLLRLTR